MCPRQWERTVIIGNTDRQDMEEVSCIRGEPVKGLEELLGPGGRGKTLLGERRVPQGEAMASLRDILNEKEPGLPVVWVSGDVLPEVSGRCVVLVPNIRLFPSIEDWADGLDEDTVVICCQEICHQVTTIFRIH